MTATPTEYAANVAASWPGRDLINLFVSFVNISFYEGFEVWAYIILRFFNFLSVIYLSLYFYILLRSIAHSKSNRQNASQIRSKSTKKFVS
jgi:hypothetical protein